MENEVQTPKLNLFELVSPKPKNFMYEKFAEFYVDSYLSTAK